MKLFSFFQKLCVWVSVLSVSTGLSFLYDLTQTPTAHAAQDGIHVTVTGTGVNGAFTLSSQNGVWDNSTNPINIPADGRVGFNISWQPVEPFHPTACWAKTQTIRYDGNFFDANQNGSGFLYPAVTNLPIVQNDYHVDGTLVPFDVSKRRVYVECDDTVNNTYYSYAFALTFRPTGTTETGECFPGYATESTSYTGSSQIFTVGASFGDGSSYARDDGGVGAVCSERQSGIEPEAFCGQRCKSYNPAFSRPQNNGGYYTNCENENVAMQWNPPPTLRPLYSQFETWVDGPTSNNVTLTQGATQNFNVSLFSYAGGLSWTYVRVGSQNGSYNNDKYGNPSLWDGWVYNSNFQSRREDVGWVDMLQYGGTTAGVSFRPASACRTNSVAARTYQDSGSVSNEQYAYYEQKYRRDGSRNSGDQNRLWGPELKVLHPFVQSQMPTIDVQVSGGTEGTDYTVDRSTIQPSSVEDPLIAYHNGVHFINPGTYTIRLNQSSFTSSIAMCQTTPDPNQFQFKDIPYNCGPNATRIQQFRGAMYPAMTTMYTVKVNPLGGGGGNSPNAQLTINGITADQNNPNRITVVPALPAGSSEDPVTTTLAANWGASNVPVNSCSVTRENPSNGITVTTNPWKDQQTGLPIGNPNAPLGFGNIVRGASTDTKFTLTCGSAGNQVSRSIRVQLSRDGQLPSGNLSFVLSDPRNGTQVIADANNPTISGEFPVYAIGEPINLSVQWTGSAGLQSNSCTIAPANANPPSVTVSGEPWQSGATNQPVSGGPNSLAINGLDTPSTSAAVHFTMNCLKYDNTQVTRTVDLTLDRSAAPPPTHSISGTVRYEDNSPVINHVVSLGSGNDVQTDSNGVYQFSNLNDGSYTITVTPETQETCQTSCSASRTVSGADIHNVDFTLILQSGGGGGNTNGNVLNSGTGSRQWSQ